jgi:outer membrane receptor for ferrienterochelin and colicins
MSCTDNRSNCTADICYNYNNRIILSRRNNLEKKQMVPVSSFSIENRSIFVVIIFLLILTCVSGISVAGETEQDLASDLKKMTLEELMNVEVATVYSASKYEQKTTEAPSSVTVITSDEIRKYGYRTLADVLKSVRGFYVTNDRNYSYVGVRGFGRPSDYNSRVLILVDGHRINDNIYDSAFIGQEFILDLDLIDHIEVIRGPGSSLYGTNAFFAVIDIFTRQGEAFQGSEVSGEAGSFDTYKGRFSYGHKFGNDADMLLSGSVLDSKGQNLFFREYESPDSHNGVSRNSDYERNYSLFSKLSYKGFMLEGAYVSRTKGIPTGAYETRLNDPRNKTLDQRGYIELGYTHTIDQQSALQARIYYDSYSYYGRYTYVEDPMTISNDIGRGDWFGGELKVNSRIFERHKLVLGTEYRYNMREDQKNYDENPFALYMDDKRHSTVWAVYVQDEFQILQNLILNAGARYDNYETFGSTINPRLALIYSPWIHTTVKLIYGKAFRTPNVYELYFYDEITSRASLNLKPEKIKTSEIIIEQYIGKDLLISVSGFYYKIKDLISQQTDPIDGLLFFKNVESVHASGIACEMKKKYESGLEGRISYSFQETRDEQTGQILTNSPKHLAKVNMIVPLIKEKLFLGLEEQYMSKRRTLADRETGAFFITNLTLYSRQFMKGMELSGSLYNLFDKKYGDPVGLEFRQDTIEQDGLSFRVKLTYRF